MRFVFIAAGVVLGAIAGYFFAQLTTFPNSSPDFRNTVLACMCIGCAIFGGAVGYAFSDRKQNWEAYLDARESKQEAKAARRWVEQGEGIGSGKKAFWAVVGGAVLVVGGILRRHSRTGELDNIDSTLLLEIFAGVLVAGTAIYFLRMFFSRSNF